MAKVRFRLRLAIPALAAAVLLAASACSGSSESPAAEGPTAAPTDAGALSLDRFHYQASLTLLETTGEAKQVSVSTEGDFQAPDRHSFTYLTGLGEASIRRSAVVIGDTAWLNEGEGPWRELGANDPQIAGLLSAAFSTIRPQFLGGPEFAQVRESVRRLPSNEEFVNDVAAEHYRVDASDSELIESFLDGGPLLQGVQELRWELWLAEDGGWPVRVLATGTVTRELDILGELGLQAPTVWELRVDISRPNDPALTVDAPE